MSYLKTIVCLANSYKPPNGRCIAGREILQEAFGQWIRPVSARETAEVSFAEYKYENNQTPQILDIVEIPLLRPEPRHHQTENHVIAAGRWVKKGRLAWNDLENIRDEPESLWINSERTKAGHYDCISQDEAAMVGDSLLLIRPENFAVDIGRNYFTGRKNFRGSFSYKGDYYSLSVTDPIVRDLFGAKEEGSYSLDEIYLCISLTEPYEQDDRCHKLIAAVISKQLLR
jgi:hypothetical protein